MAREDDNMEDEGLGILELEENLSDIEKPPVIPRGRYLGEVQDVQVQTSGKGNKYYSVLFHISAQELPAAVADAYEDGVTLFWNRQLVPRGGKDRRTLYNLRQFLEALGLDANTNVVDPNEWMGCTAMLNVIVGRYQGEDRPEIRSVEMAESNAPARAAPTRRAKAAPREEEAAEEEEAEEEAPAPAPRRGGRR